MNEFSLTETMRKYWLVCTARTTQAFQSRWNEFIDSVPLNSAGRTYLAENVLPIKEKFCDAFNRGVPHLGCLTTNRVESLHAQFKRKLMNSKSPLLQVFQGITDVFADTTRRTAEIERQQYIHRLEGSPMRQKVAGNLTQYAAEIFLTHADIAMGLGTYPLTNMQAEDGKLVEGYAVGPLRATAEENFAEKASRVRIINKELSIWECSCCDYNNFLLPCPISSPFRGQRQSIPPNSMN
jgi:hypothetical protein